MKKITTLFICFLYSIHLSYSQTDTLSYDYKTLIALGITSSEVSHGKVPKSSIISLVKAKTYITAFQQNNDYNFPSSFVINASDLIKYFKLVSPPPTYMHIYSMLKNPALPSMISFALTPAIIGRSTHFFRTNLDYSPDGGTTYDVFANSTSCPSCSVSYDPNLDPVQFDAAQFSIPNSSLVSVSDAKGFIANYQTQYSDPKPYLNYPESFLIRASNLMNFLINPAIYQIQNETGLPVVALQIYLGKDLTQPKLSQQIKIIIVGVDENGDHVYFNNQDGNEYVLEEVLPCPVCGLTHDDKLDKDDQAYFLK